MSHEHFPCLPSSHGQPVRWHRYLLDISSAANEHMVRDAMHVVRVTRREGGLSMLAACWVFNGRSYAVFLALFRSQGIVPRVALRLLTVHQSAGPTKLKELPDCIAIHSASCNLPTQKGRRNKSIQLKTGV